MTGKRYCPVIKVTGYVNVLEYAGTQSHWATIVAPDAVYVAVGPPNRQQAGGRSSMCACESELVQASCQLLVKALYLVHGIYVLCPGGSTHRRTAVCL